MLFRNAKNKWKGFYWKSYLERPRINGKAFRHSGFFFINNKRNGKKLRAEINSVSSQLYSCS